MEIIKMSKVVRKMQGTLILEGPANTKTIRFSKEFEELSREPIEFPMEKFPKNFEDATKEVAESNSRIMEVKKQLGIVGETFYLELTFIV